MCLCLGFLAVQSGESHLSLLLWLPARIAPLSVPEHSTLQKYQSQVKLVLQLPMAASNIRALQAGLLEKGSWS